MKRKEAPSKPQTVKFISVAQIIEKSGGALTPKAVRAWDADPEAPKPVKMGTHHNARRAYLEQEVDEYFARLIERRTVTAARATELGRAAALRSWGPGAKRKRRTEAAQQTEPAAA